MAKLCEGVLVRLFIVQLTMANFGVNNEVFGFLCVGNKTIEWCM